MSLASAYRLTFHLTLAWATFALAQADSFFLRWMPYFAVAAIGLIVLAWRYEGRWEMSESTANHLALAIALACFGWILYKLPRSDEDLAVGGVPWPAGLLPHLAPLVTVLILAKLYRPKKQSDFWVFQAMGLIAMILGSVLAGEATFLVLLGGYMASLIASLTTAYRMRERLRAQGSGSDRLFGSDRESPSGRPWLGVASWVLTCCACGIFFYLLLPRFGTGQWSPTKLIVTGPTVRTKTGSADSGMDLNRGGKIELSSEIAFEVVARDVLGRMTDLPAGMYWRTEVLDFTRKGRWYTSSQAVELAATGDIKVHLASMRTGWQKPIGPNRLPPSLKPGQTYLRFRLQPTAVGGLPLAEPVDIKLGAGGYPRIENGVSRELFAWMAGAETFQSLPGTRRLEHEYGQIIDLEADSTRQKADQVRSEYIQYILQQSVPDGLAAWTKDLLDRLPEGKAVRRHEDLVAAEDHEMVAQALCRHLALSHDYKYSLDRPRSERTLDPTMDFLLNVKEGHCERFAAALVLMLRSQGVPSRIVRGYAGVERLEESDAMVVRQNRAHSWVQTFVSGKTPGTKEWILLDPTPGGASASTSSSSVGSWDWLMDNLDLRQVWNRLIVEYNSDLQAGLWLMLGRAVAESIRTNPVTWIVSAVGLVAAAALVRMRRFWIGICFRSKRSAPRAEIHPAQRFTDRFRSLTKRWGGDVHPGMTARELASALSARLALVFPESAAAPAELADRYYGMRFGAQAGSIVDLEADLAALEAIPRPKPAS